LTTKTNSNISQRAEIWANGRKGENEFRPIREFREGQKSEPREFFRKRYRGVEAHPRSELPEGSPKRRVSVGVLPPRLGLAKKKL